VLPLADGQALKLTTSRYFTPSGASIHERGIAPDVELPEVATPAATDAPLLERDADVRAAIGWLKTDRPALVATETAPVRR
jgi:carboxyl-terminal processing protease